MMESLLESYGPREYVGTIEIPNSDLKRPSYRERKANRYTVAGSSRFGAAAKAETRAAKRVVNEASMTATFSNECAFNIDIYWAETPETAREAQTKLAEIAQGAVLDFNTFVGHTFVARRGTRLLDTFQMSREQKHYFVEA